MGIVYHDEIKAFIKTLEKSTQSKVVRGIELIEQYGQNLGMPHVKKITASLYELRIRGQQEVRIFYAENHGRAILLHGFVKKTKKTPQREIETAQKRLMVLTSI